MLRSILVGLDGSAYSFTALELGIDWAKRHKAHLVGFGYMDGRTHSFAQQCIQRCEEAGLPLDILENVSLVPAQINWTIQRYDLLILSQRTQFSLEPRDRCFEILERVLKTCSRPVVIAPKELGPLGGAAVVAYDASAHASRAVQLFTLLGLAEGRRMHVVAVDAEFPEAEKRANQALRYLEGHRIEAGAHGRAPQPGVTEAILASLGDLNADVLVMGAYGENSVREMFLGSTTRAIVQKCSVPVFLYH